MANEFKRGDRVEWNYRGTVVTGRIRRRLTKRAEVGGQIAAASAEDPRYIVRVESSGKEIARRPSALRHAD